MDLLLVIEAIGYFGIIGLEIYWQIHGIRNERRFALLQVASLSLIVITVGLLNYSPKYPFGLVAVVTSVFLLWIIVYPIARWIYRQFFPPK
jgi:hypothetical protein